MTASYIVGCICLLILLGIFTWTFTKDRRCGPVTLRLPGEHSCHHHRHHRGDHRCDCGIILLGPSAMFGSGALMDCHASLRD